MNTVQELIDENMDRIPTGLAKTLLEACKAEADAKPNLYRITLTRVTGTPYMQEIDEEDVPCVKLHDVTQTMIVESVDNATFQAMDIHHKALLNKGFIRDSWIRSVKPCVMREYDSEIIVIHSIESYNPSKRARTH
jgi:hypothetical protein